MAFTRIHHVGILVGDLEVARRVFGDGFGLAVDEHRSPWPGGRAGDFDGVRTVEIPLGEMHLEISTPTDLASPSGRFVAERRGGMYYLSLASDDLEADVGRLVEKGIQTEGAWEGRGPVFVDPATCLGLRIQLTPEDHYYAHPHYRGEGVLTGMAHVGIAARSADEIRKLLGETFGLYEEASGGQRPELRPEVVANQPASDPVHILMFPLGGSTIEISIPLDEVSGTARLVAQRAPRGAVYHHICPFAPDVHRAVEVAKAAGLEQIGGIPPREESRLATAWFHPRSCAGTLVEIWNRPPGKEHAHQYRSRSR